MFGSYTNSAAVYDRRRLAQLGEQHEGKHTIYDHDTPEGRFSIKSKNLVRFFVFLKRCNVSELEIGAGIDVCTTLEGGTRGSCQIQR